MKKYLPVYLLLTAMAVANLRCAHDDDSSNQITTCLPTILPGYRAAMTITYNKDHKVASVHYDAYPGGAISNYQELYAYFNGRLSRINIRRNGKVEVYKMFTYDGLTMTENHYHVTNGNQNQVIVYYLAPNGKQILGWARHGNDERDSVTFTYTGHNITRMDAYDSNDEVVYYYCYEYDNKANPFTLAGLSGEDAEYFKPVNISQNNITRSERHDVDNTDHTEFAYTYDKDDRPVSRTTTHSGAANDPAQTITYMCD